MKYLLFLVLSLLSKYAQEFSEDCYIPDEDKTDCQQFFRLRRSETPFCRQLFHANPQLPQRLCEDLLFVSLSALDADLEFIQELSLNAYDGMFYIPYPKGVPYLLFKSYFYNSTNHTHNVLDLTEMSDKVFTYRQVYYFYESGVSERWVEARVPGEHPKLLSLFRWDDSFTAFAPRDTQKIELRENSGAWVPVEIATNPLYTSKNINGCEKGFKVVKPVNSNPRCTADIRVCVDFSSNRMRANRMGHTKYHDGEVQSSLDLTAAIFSYASVFFGKARLTATFYAQGVIKSIQSGGPDDFLLDIKQGLKFFRRPGTFKFNERTPQSIKLPAGALQDSGNVSK